jgi:hypothetical protein
MGSTSASVKARRINRFVFTIGFFIVEAVSFSERTKSERVAQPGSSLRVPAVSPTCAGTGPVDTPPPRAQSLLPQERIGTGRQTTSIPTFALRSTGFSRILVLPSRCFCGDAGASISCKRLLVKHQELGSDRTGLRRDLSEAQKASRRTRDTGLTPLPGRDGTGARRWRAELSAQRVGRRFP